MKCPFKRNPLFQEMGRFYVHGFMCKPMHYSHQVSVLSRQENSVAQFQGGWWFLLCEEQHSSVLMRDHSWKEHSRLL